MIKDGGRKPIYTMDFFPTLKTSGIISLFFFFFAFLITFFIMIYVDFYLGLLYSILFIMGGFVGRDFESRHHKMVMGHMTEDFQRLYKDIEYGLAKADVDEAKKQQEDIKK